MPGARETEEAVFQRAVGETRTAATGLGRTLGVRAGGSWWPRNYQWPGLISTALTGLGLARARDGASEDETAAWLSGGRTLDWVGSLGLAATARNAADLPTALQLVRESAQAAASQSTFAGQAGRFFDDLGAGVGRQLAAIGERALPETRLAVGVAARGLQTLGALGGVVAGGFQIDDGIDMLCNEERVDDWVGRGQLVGGVATISGSAILGLAAVGAISAPLVVGAAPILLGAGAIAGAGALVYNALKDEGLGERLEEAANRPGGFSDTMIAAGREVVGWFGGED